MASQNPPPAGNETRVQFGKREGTGSNPPKTPPPPASDGHEYVYDEAMSLRPDAETPEKEPPPKAEEPVPPKAPDPVPVETPKSKPPPAPIPVAPKVGFVPPPMPPALPPPPKPPATTPMSATEKKDAMEESKKNQPPADRPAAATPKKEEPTKKKEESNFMWWLAGAAVIIAVVFFALNSAKKSSEPVEDQSIVVLATASASATKPPAATSASAAVPCPPAAPCPKLVATTCEKVIDQESIPEDMWLGATFEIAGKKILIFFHKEKTGLLSYSGIPKDGPAVLAKIAAEPISVYEASMEASGYPQWGYHPASVRFGEGRNLKIEGICFKSVGFYLPCGMIAQNDPPKDTKKVYPPNPVRPRRINPKPQPLPRPRPQPITHVVALPDVPMAERADRIPAGW